MIRNKYARLIRFGIRESAESKRCLPEARKWDPYV